MNAIKLSLVAAVLSVLALSAPAATAADSAGGLIHGKDSKAWGLYTGGAGFVIGPVASRVFFSDAEPGVKSWASYNTSTLLWKKAL